MELARSDQYPTKHPSVAKPAGFRSLVAIPEHIYPFALIPVGWPAGAFQTVDRFKPELIHRETWQTFESGRAVISPLREPGFAAFQQCQYAFTGEMKPPGFNASTAHSSSFMMSSAVLPMR